MAGRAPRRLLTTRGELTARQRAAAAYLYAGPGMAVTGSAALAWHGSSAEPEAALTCWSRLSCRAAKRRIRAAAPDRDRAERGLAGTGRSATRRRRGPWPMRSRQLADPAEIRAVVAAGVQRGKVHDLAVSRGTRRGARPGVGRAAAGIGGGGRRGQVGGRSGPAAADPAGAAAHAVAEPAPVRRTGSSWPARTPGGPTPGWPSRWTRGNGTCPRRSGSRPWPGTPG